MSQEPVKITVYVEGGCVTHVDCPEFCKVEIIDHDNDGHAPDCAIGNDGACNCLPSDPTRDLELGKRYIEVARNLYENDDIEIDDDAKLSPNDIGAWVQAWLFVHTEEITLQATKAAQ